MKRLISLLLAIALCLSLCACGTKGKPLAEVAREDPSSLSVIVGSREKVICKDYTVYSTGGGIDDSIDATRYARGLSETTDRFVSFEYIVEDNKTGWKYIFESFNDLLIWAENS